MLTQYFFLVYCFFLCGLFGLWLLVTRRFRTAAGYAAAELAGLGAAYLAFPTMKQHIFSGSRGKQAFTSVFDVSALADWAASLGRVFRLLAAQFGWRALWGVVLAAVAILLWRRGARLRGNGLFAAGLLLAACGYVVLIDKAAPFEADRYYVVIYEAGAGDDAASLQAAAQSRDLQDGFVVYGYVYDADALKTMIEDTLDTESVELLTDVAKCPVYYVKLK